MEFKTKFPSEHLVFVDVADSGIHKKTYYIGIWSSVVVTL